jgi:Flp pilus assembly protein TadD
LLCAAAHFCVPLLAAGDYAEAINLYDQALSHAPGDVRLYNNRAIAKLYLDK